MAALTTLLPGRGPDLDAPRAGSVFKVERGPAGEKVAYARLRSGVLQVHDRLRFRDEDQTVTGIGVFEHGSIRRATSLEAGQIGKVWGLVDVQVGDVIGAASTAPARPLRAADARSRHGPARPEQTGALHRRPRPTRGAGPLIDLRQDAIGQELYVSLYGEVQREVLQTMLANDYGIDVDFRETTTICIERPVAAGEALELRQGWEPVRGKRGTAHRARRCRVRVHLPLPRSRPGAIPDRPVAVEETTRKTLRQGLSGWQVVRTASSR